MVCLKWRELGVWHCVHFGRCKMWSEKNKTVSQRSGRLAFLKYKKKIALRVKSFSGVFADNKLFSLTRVTPGALRPPRP